MIDRKRMKQLDRAYRDRMKRFSKSRKYSEYPIKGKPAFDRTGTITEKQTTPSGGCVLCIRDGEDEISETELNTKAEAFAIRRNGRSPRTARQFIELLKIGI